MLIKEGYVPGSLARCIQEQLDTRETELKKEPGRYRHSLHELRRAFSNLAARVERYQRLPYGNLDSVYRLVLLC
jgi:hypothetical protein